MVKQYFRYTAGRLETPADRPVIRKVLEDFQKSQFHFKELIVSISAFEGISELRRDCSCRS